MNKKTIFFLLTCLLLIASITYIICNKREQVPPMLVWEGQKYYVTNERQSRRSWAKARRSNKET